MSMDKIWNGKNYLDNELEAIVNKIKYLKPFKGYLVCNNVTDTINYSLVNHHMISPMNVNAVENQNIMKTMIFFKMKMMNPCYGEDQTSKR